MQKGRYHSQSGEEYELIGLATDSETSEKRIIYRKANDSRVFVCSELYWDGLELISSAEYKSSGITKYSPGNDKIELYLSLFGGRSDVYAKRWESRSGKSGYSPVCSNEWRPGVCLKPSGKCSDCSFKSYEPFNASVVEKHLRGQITAGVYPLCKDETCRFLAVDFDDGDWQKDICAVYELCKTQNIPAYMERSRSGSGGHLWIFFSESIPTPLARRLGSSILTAAMNERHEIGFSSYDRLFPNQDTMPKGGFGNLIALPLQKQPRKNGNSVFVDERLEPYSDQWQLLSSVKRLSEADVRRAVNTFGSEEMGPLYEDNSEKPWEKKNLVRVSGSDIPPRVNIVLANMVYVEKTGISSRGLNAIKRFASFKNPDFYKSQAMRLSTYGKPRIISLSDETDKYIALPRGLCEEITRFFINHGAELCITDKTNKGRVIDVEFNGVLRPEQEEAKTMLMKKDCGVLSASTAFGKTVVGAAMIAERKVNTLILVHRTSLLKQWIERLNEFLIINEEPPVEYTPTRRRRKTSVIGQIGGNKNKPGGIIDVAVMQSLISDGEVRDIVKDYGMVIVDECHHVSAFTFEQILRNTNAKYVYGLTATPVRQDGHQPIIYMQCGTIAYRADNRKQTQENPFERCMIPRFTALRCESDKIYDMYNVIATDDLRNELICEDCIKNVKEGRTPVILTERTAHVDILADMLKEYKVIKLVGGMGSKKNNEISQELKQADKNEPLILIATGKYIGEGFDYPRLDTLMLAMPISWKGTLQQYAGRLHRSYNGKDEVRVYDYIDIHVPMLEKMYQKRLKGYSSIGYKVKSEDGYSQNISGIYNNESFLEVFVSDIIGSEKAPLL